MFLKLTLTNDSTIYINADKIESFGVITKDGFRDADDQIGKTYIVPCGVGNEDALYVVEEKPEEILGMIV